MENTQELLTFIYENAQMGIIGIDNVINDIKDSTFLNIIKEQRNDYYDITNKVKEYAHTLNYSLDEVSSIAKIMTYLDAKAELLTDKSVSTIAKMMLKGSNKGIIKITEKINNYMEDDKKTLSLAKELLRIENNNLNNLKKYIK